MKNNAKYTALEIISEAFPTGVVTLDEKEFSIAEVFGKYGIMIGGLRGIVSPEHLICIPSGTEELECSIGSEFATLKIESGDEEKFHSEESRLVLSAEAEVEVAKE